MKNTKKSIIKLDSKSQDPYKKKIEDKNGWIKSLQRSGQVRQESKARA